MRCEVVCIGDELLRGDTLNTNAAYLGQALAGMGVRIHRETCVADDRCEIAGGFREALSRSEVVVGIGGLGPTRDDVTRQAAADVLGRPLVERPDVAAAIRQYLHRRAIDIPDSAVRIQATLPEGAEILPNETGTAPGLWCQAPGQSILALLPGPPRECRPMIDAHLLPRIAARLGDSAPRVRTMLVCGLPESVVEEAVTDLAPPGGGIAVGFCATPLGLTLRLETSSEEDCLAEVEEAIRERLAANVIASESASLVEDIGRLLQHRGWMLGLAESCTGGLIGSTITEQSGVSAWFAGSAVTYSNAWKERVLNVSRNVLESHGAVSEPTVRQMLAGVRQGLDVDAAAAVSGVAGPSGGTADKPVGTVVIGVSVGDRDPVVVTRQFPGNRETVRLRTLGSALVMVRAEILQCGPAEPRDGTD